MRYFSIYAGEHAYQTIQSKGFTPNIITSIFGASGAAKWLGIYGLDRALFTEWLIDIKHPIHLFGTSVGAWKLAAAAQADPGRAIDNFANAYIAQHYGDSTTHNDVTRETQKILDKFLSSDAIIDILQNPRFYFHCGAVRCHGTLASERKLTLALALSVASARNFRSRQQLAKSLQRIVFADPRQAPPLVATTNDHFKTEKIRLSHTNFYHALKASGAIPYLMPGVAAIDNAPPGMYRDGGLVDYHPCPADFWSDESIILYPHFYPHLIPGWFDKPLQHRRATAQQLRNVILISPTQAFIDTLPFARLPDRNDFKRFYKQDRERQRHWQNAASLSMRLGEEFMALANSGELTDSVLPLPTF